MKDIELSVIIPVYNTEKYLKRCLDSVIKAVKKSDVRCEIIIINDGSKDNSEDIVKEYLKEYTELIKYYKKENAGLADTKNVGIKMANGKYLSFIDSDDYIDEDFYYDSFQIIKAENIDMVICDWETIDIENNNKYIVEAKNNLYEDDMWGCIDTPIMPSSCNKIVKKGLFNDLEFPKGLRYEDLGTTLILFFRAKSIKYMNKPYYKYCLTPGSIMRTDFDERNLQMIEIFNILFDRIEKLDISKDKKDKALYMVYTRRFYEEILEKIVLSNKKKYLIKEFCDKIKLLDQKFWKNKYFIMLISYQGKKRKKILELLHKAIQNTNYKLLSLYLTKRLYYKYFAIRYMSIDKIMEE